MMILIAGDDDNWPDADTYLVSCDELHTEGIIMTLLFGWKIITFDLIF